MSTAVNIRNAMDRLGLTQADIVRRAAPYCEEYKTRFGSNDINQYLKGKYSPKGIKLTILCKILDVSPAYILDLEQVLDEEEAEVLCAYRLCTKNMKSDVKKMLGI